MNWLYAYYQAIEDGSVTVGKWIKLWYEILIHGIENGTYTYNQKKANKAIKFIENFCHHCEGRDDLLKLELWQKAIISVLFGIMDRDGNRQFREAIIIMGRKNGKTLFASAVTAYMAYLDGEYGAKVYNLAPKLEQANILYDNFYQMVQKEPELAQLAKKRRSDIYIEQFNTSVKPIAFNAKKSDGFNPHLVVCDEISSWQGDAGLKQYEVMKSALGARKQPLMLSISTSGYINDGIYDELMKRATSFLLGSSSETRIAPFLYMIDDTDRWNDINELRKANPNLGVSVSVDYLLEEIAIAEGSLSKKAEFLAKYCNIKQNSSVAWLEYKQVEGCAGEELHLEDFRDCYCVGGIDLSRTTDMTSACIVIEKNDKLYVISRFWLPTNRIEDLQAEDGAPYDVFVKRGWLTKSGENVVDYQDCFNWFASLVNDYSIYPLQIGYDRYNALQLTQQMQSFGFHMDDVYQGFNLSSVIDELFGVIADRKIDFGNNSLLQSHLLNTALKEDMETQRKRIVKVAGRHRIDGTAALLCAMTVRQKWYQDLGEQLKNQERSE